MRTALITSCMKLKRAFSVFCIFMVTFVALAHTADDDEIDVTAGMSKAERRAFLALKKRIERAKNAEANQTQPGANKPVAKKKATPVASKKVVAQESSDDSDDQPSKVDPVKRERLLKITCDTMFALWQDNSRILVSESGEFPDIQFYKDENTKIWKMHICPGPCKSHDDLAFVVNGMGYPNGVFSPASLGIGGHIYDIQDVNDLLDYVKDSDSKRPDDLRRNCTFPKITNAMANTSFGDNERRCLYDFLNSLYEVQYGLSKDDIEDLVRFALKSKVSADFQPKCKSVLEPRFDDLP
jgi:hypothetical protein